MAELFSLVGTQRFPLLACVDTFSTFFIPRLALLQILLNNFATPIF
ncbi:hypothetical protein PAUR_b0144 [Pseudoalteromonas aurantia 208]|uniref:Uncharacterized protein n=1 Tax=Pseudoalteromonas aurantia 208 TaxID=1314867 RepID=A0ABR9EHG4_9GAMM|nr:hypothetical protein [Pseudoalteromonas aurantia 208]